MPTIDNARTTPDGSGTPYFTSGEAGAANAVPQADAINTVAGPPGPTGADGPPGPIGLIGPQGVKGDIGPEGPIGPSGGPPGPEGPAGPQGIVGIEGPIGKTGAGVSNATINGAYHLIFTISNSATSTNYTVDAGLLPTGPQGIAGPPGAKGDTGATGAPGAQGIQGTQGLTGIQGMQGAKGDTGITGATGAQGPQGNTGVSVSNATINSSQHLIITLSNSSQIDAGLVPTAGAAGANGAQGNAGVSISNATINANSHLILTLSNSSQIDAGKIPSGPQGNAGVSVSSATINPSQHLILTLSNSGQIDAGLIPSGQQGPQGNAGVSVSNATINSSFHLILTLSNSSQIDAGLIPSASQNLSLNNSTIAATTINGTLGVSDLIANKYANRLMVEAKDYGIITASASAAANNAVIINSLMAGIAARGGGTLVLPAGTIYVSSTLDNKFSRVLVRGAGKETAPGDGVFSKAGTYIYATNPFNGTAVLKHRTPYSPTSYANWGGGFVDMSINGELGASVRLLEVDSIQSSTMDLVLANGWGDALAYFMCGISDQDLAGTTCIQNGDFDLTTNSFFGSQSIHSVVLDGSVNADVSINKFTLKQYYSGSGKALWLRNQDTNYFELVNQVQGTMAGGYGIYCSAQGADTRYADSSGGTASMINFYMGQGPFYLEGLEVANATAGSYLVINHFDLGSNVPLENAYIGKSARLEWRDHKGNFNNPSSWQPVAMGPWANEQYWAGTGMVVYAPTCTTTSGSPTLSNMSSAKGEIYADNGHLITGTNIPNGTFVRNLTWASSDTGTVTSATNLINASATVSGKTWTTNSWANYRFRVTEGTGSGQYIEIKSNTSNTLIFDGVFATPLNNTSVYTIEKISTVTMSQNATGTLAGGNVQFTRDIPATRTTESLRLANFTGDTLRLWNPLTSAEWGIGIGSNGNLQFNRIYGSGVVEGLSSSSGGNYADTSLSNVTGANFGGKEFTVNSGVRARSSNARASDVSDAQDFHPNGSWGVDAAVDTLAVENAIAAMGSGRNTLIFPDTTFLIVPNRILTVPSNSRLMARSHNTVAKLGGKMDNNQMLSFNTEYNNDGTLKRTLENVLIEGLTLNGNTSTYKRTHFTCTYTKQSVVTTNDTLTNVSSTVGITAGMKIIGWLGYRGTVVSTTPNTITVTPSPSRIATAGEAKWCWEVDPKNNVVNNKPSTASDCTSNALLGFYRTNNVTLRDIIVADQQAIGVSFNAGSDNSWIGGSSTLNIPDRSPNSGLIVASESSSYYAKNFTLRDVSLVNTAYQLDCTDPIFENVRVKDAKYGGCGSIAMSEFSRGLRMIGGKYSGANSTDADDTAAPGIESFGADASFIGVTVEGNGGYGLTIGGKNNKIIGCTFRNNGWEFAGSNGLQMRYSDATYNPYGAVLEGNRAYDDKVTKTQTYGLGFVDTEINGVLYQVTGVNIGDGNDWSGNLTGDIQYTNSAININRPKRPYEINSSFSFPGATIGNGSIVAWSGQVNGATFGDFVLIGYSFSLNNCTAMGFVQADSSVQVVFTNNTGSGVTLPAGTIYVRVLKR